MEKFYLEEASLKRKEQAIDYIKEHLEYKSNIAGDSNLEEMYQDYEGWIEYMNLLKNPNTVPDGLCPGVVYFLIRVSDDKLVSMINIRWNLNEWMQNFGGHIGYGTRPTERKKGYNKINLYLGLIKCQELGLEKVMLSANNSNVGSFKTILALGGVLDKYVPSYDSDEDMGIYYIDVNNSINKYRNVYEDYIYEDIIRKY